MCDIITTKTRAELLMQLHITGRCNQHCKHCYHTEYVNEPLSLENIEDILKQYIELLKKYNQVKKIDVPGRINITGGEPFIRKDFFDILRMLHEYKDYFSYVILTNGSYITKDNIDFIKEMEPSHIQVSIDGDRETHDFIRGAGNYDQTFRTIDLLREHGIRTDVSFTVSKLNQKAFPAVVQACKEHNVTKVWSDRIVPVGNGSALLEQCLSPEETLEYFQVMKREQDKAIAENSYTEVYIKRALQFIVTKKDIYGCLAGDTAFAIDEFGNVLPCRRMPIPCGNVLKENLSDIYFHSPVFNDLRKRTVCDDCSQCRFNRSCNGGSKCISYAINKDYKTADPFCPLIYYNRNKNKSN